MNSLVGYSVCWGLSSQQALSYLQAPPFCRAGSAFELGAQHKNITAVYQPPTRARPLAASPAGQAFVLSPTHEVTPPQAVICHTSGDSCGLSLRR